MSSKHIKYYSNCAVFVFSFDRFAVLIWIGLNLNTSSLGIYVSWFKYFWDIICLIFQKRHNMSFYFWLYCSYFIHRICCAKNVLVYLCFFSFYKKYYISYNSKRVLFELAMLNLLKEILVIHCSPTQLERLISVVAPIEYSIHIQQNKI